MSPMSPMLSMSLFANRNTKIHLLPTLFKTRPRFVFLSSRFFQTLPPRSSPCPSINCFAALHRSPLVMLAERAALLNHAVLKTRCAGTCTTYRFDDKHRLCHLVV